MPWDRIFFGCVNDAEVELEKLAKEYPLYAIFSGPVKCFGILPSDICIGEAGNQGLRFRGVQDVGKEEIQRIVVAVHRRGRKPAFVPKVQELLRQARPSKS